MKYRIDFQKGDELFYNAPGLPCRVRVIDVNPESLDERYTIQVLTNRNFVYRKGCKLTTSGNWLRKSPPKSSRSKLPKIQQRANRG